MSFQTSSHLLFPLLLLSTLIFPTATAFQSPTKNKLTPIPTTTSLQAKQTYIYDGGEYQSFLLNNNNNNNLLSSSLKSPAREDAPDNTVGCVTFVTSSGFIGILAQDSTTATTTSSLETMSLDGMEVYTDTVAKIPDGISENDAMSTAAASLVGLHCGVPRVSGVGGGEEGFYSGKVGNVLFYLMAL